MPDSISLKKLSESSARTRWFVEVPAALGKPAKSYYVSTYPNSDVLSLESAKTGRAIPKGIAYNLIPRIKIAINQALAEEDQAVIAS